VDAIRRELIAELEKIEGLEVRAAKVAGGAALFHNGIAFAHFHNDHELDLRLTKTLIKRLGLSHPKVSVHHPARSQNSDWIELSFHESSDVTRIAELVALAMAHL